MHLPDGILPLDQSIVYLIISIIIFAISYYKFSIDEDKNKNIVLIALLAATTFVISSLSIPSPFGVPIHFFIIPIIVILLGPINGIIVEFLVLIIQAFIGMGGLVSFGANFLVIGIILSLTTYLFYKIFSYINNKLAIVLSTIIGIMAATFAQIIILTISGTNTFEILLSTLLPFYLLIAIIESFANLVIITSIEKVKPELLNKNKIY